MQTLHAVSDARTCVLEHCCFVCLPICAVSAHIDAVKHRNLPFIGLCYASTTSPPLAIDQQRWSASTQLVSRFCRVVRACRARRMRGCFSSVGCIRTWLRADARPSLLPRLMPHKLLRCCPLPDLVAATMSFMGSVPSKWDGTARTALQIITTCSTNASLVSFAAECLGAAQCHCLCVPVAPVALPIHDHSQRLSDTALAHDNLRGIQVPNEALSQPPKLAQRA